MKVGTLCVGLELGEGNLLETVLVSVNEGVRLSIKDVRVVVFGLERRKVGHLPVTDGVSVDGGNGVVLIRDHDATIAHVGLSNNSLVLDANTTTSVGSSVEESSRDSGVLLNGLDRSIFEERSLATSGLSSTEGGLFVGSGEVTDVFRQNRCGIREGNSL